TVQRSDAPDNSAGDGHVGYLRCHRNHKRKIDEVPVVRTWRSRKFKAADLIVAAFAVIFVRVVQGENNVEEQPGQQYGAHTESKVGSACSGLCVAELHDDGCETGDRSRGRKDQQRRSTFVMDRCTAADFIDG